jgi:hypothetical protein
MTIISLPGLRRKTAGPNQPRWPTFGWLVGEIGWYGAGIVVAALAVGVGGFILHVSRVLGGVGF